MQIVIVNENIDEGHDNHDHHYHFTNRLKHLVFLQPPEHHHHSEHYKQVCENSHEDVERS